MHGARHTHRLRVRYAECDPQGHVFNANYFTYFDIALTELWREALGPYDEMVQAGVDMVVREATARYHAPARFDDELDVEVAVEKLGETSMVTSMRVTRGEDLLVEGQMVHVFVERDGYSKIPIPEDIRAALGGGAGAATPSSPATTTRPPSS